MFKGFAYAAFENVGFDMSIHFMAYVNSMDSKEIKGFH